MLADIASLATAAGVLAAVVQLLLSRRQARAGFEHAFVVRYWELDDERLEARDNNGIYWRRYLRLCEDEFESMRLGQISWRTWEVWHDAIRDRFDDTHCALTDARPEEFEWLRVCLGEARHSGADCWGIFAPATQEHSKHISARWKSSPTLRSFLLANAIRRWAYAGHEERMQRRRAPRNR